MADDGIFNKAASIERCPRRITEEYSGNRQNLFEHQTKQDARHARKAFRGSISSVSLFRGYAVLRSR
ncbi:MAG TPA: hypothetical protein PK224_02335 [Nitrospira sp.]|nr:hypothetical protein [Nitrospira sp.]